MSNNLARLVINQLLQDLIGTEQLADNPAITINAKNIRDLIQHLDNQYPGLKTKLESGHAVAIDGEIFTDPWLETLKENSEVCFLPAIEGG